MRRHLITMLIVILAMPLTFGALDHNGNAESPVTIYIFGPDIVATESVSDINISVVGGPAEEGGNYSIEAYLEGTNLTGASPLKTSPHPDTSQNGTFKMNITAPTIPQTVTLVVNATSVKDERRVSTETEHTIRVVAPITINAKIENSGSLKVKDISVKFYVDGEFIGNQTIKSLNAGASTEVSHEWLIADLSPGQHVIWITADLNNDGVISESDGDIVIIQYFYKAYEPLHPAIIVFVSIIMVFVFLLLYRTLRKRKRGW